jgi:hypothetical protein
MEEAGNWKKNSLKLLSSRNAVPQRRGLGLRLGNKSKVRLKAIYDADRDRPIPPRMFALFDNSGGGD